MELLCEWNYILLAKIFVVTVLVLILPPRSRTIYLVPCSKDGICWWILPLVLSISTSLAYMDAASGSNASRNCLTGISACLMYEQLLLMICSFIGYFSVYIFYIILSLISSFEFIAWNITIIKVHTTTIWAIYFWSFEQPGIGGGGGGNNIKEFCQKNIPLFLSDWPKNLRTNWVNELIYLFCQSYRTLYMCNYNYVLVYPFKIDCFHLKIIVT